MRGVTEMRIGIQQPYFMPYIGYWQRINAVDAHVILDDVNYIKRGWANRNRILINGEISNFNMPVLGASQNKLFTEVKMDTSPEAQEKLCKKIEFSYKRAPYYNKAMPVIERILRSNDNTVATYLEYEIRTLAEYMGIDTKIVLSSCIKGKKEGLKGEDKILNICEMVGANRKHGGITYVNASSGEKLYHKERFYEKGIDLLFIKDKSTVRYSQIGRSEFVPSLSIIDVLMNCSLDEIRKLLSDYQLYRI